MTMVEAGFGVSILAELVLRRTNYHIVMRPADPPIKRTPAIGYKDRNSLPIYEAETALPNGKSLLRLDFHRQQQA